MSHFAWVLETNVFVMFFYNLYIIIKNTKGNTKVIVEVKP